MPLGSPEHSPGPRSPTSAAAAPPQPFALPFGQLLSYGAVFLVAWVLGAANTAGDTAAKVFGPSDAKGSLDTQHWQLLLLGAVGLAALWCAVVYPLWRIAQTESEASADFPYRSRVEQHLRRRGSFEAFTLS